MASNEMTSQETTPHCAVRRRLTAATSAVSIATYLCLASGHAQAQATATAAPVLDEIVVTGSRIVTAGFEAPTPVTVVTADQLLVGQSLISQGLNDLPSMYVGGAERATNSTAGAGQATVNLRALGSNRTLVLLDGRRVAPQGSSGDVDVSLMPNALVSRVDIVTGGASAAYGSDAVSGVVNYVLDKEFVGAKVSGQYGISYQSDRPEYRFEGAGGFAFASGRGHFLLSAEYYDSATLTPAQRDWAQTGANIISNVPGAFPRQLRVEDARRADSSPGGLIVGGPLDGITFDANGNPRPFLFGSLRTSGNSIGGEGVRGTFGDIQALAGALNRFNTFNRISYDVTDNVNFYVENMYGSTGNLNLQGIPYANGALAPTIRSDNPFIPDALRAQMAAANVTSFRLGKIFTDMPLVSVNTDMQTWRSVIGADFQINDWTANVYYQRGMTWRYTTNPGQLDQIGMFNSLDAVRVPTTGAPAGLVPGSIVCRITLTNPQNRCIPYNPMGTNVNSPQARYANSSGPWNISGDDLLDQSFGSPYRTLFRDEEYQQDVASAQISGEVFDGWAGPISSAVGIEYRHEEIIQSTDPYSQVVNPITQGFGGWRAGAALPYEGEVSVKEAFFEGNVPLLSEQPGAESLDLNGAVRITDYSTSGTVVTWKAGLSYRPFSDLLLRGTRSRDIAAPTLQNLYQQGTSGAGTLTDPFVNQSLGGVRIFTRGNRNLVPEVANTTVIGTTYQPAWATGIRLSVDYWDIKIDGAFGSVSPQDVLNTCFADRTSALCNFIVRDAGGALLRIENAPFNFQRFQTDGFDIEASYDTIAPEWVPGLADGNLKLRVLATRINHSKTIPPGSAIATDTAGTNSFALSTGGLAATPRWRGLAQFTAAKEAFNGSITVKYVSGGKYNNTYVEGVDINDNDIGSYHTVDTRIAYQLPLETVQTELYVSVSNILDRTPPKVEFNGTQPFVTNIALYDMLGRYFRIGLNLNY